MMNQTMKKELRKDLVRNEPGNLKWLQYLLCSLHRLHLFPLDLCGRGIGVRRPQEYRVVFNWRISSQDVLVYYAGLDLFSHFLLFFILSEHVIWFTAFFSTFWENRGAR
jgi:hypothetical protein